MLAVVTGVTVMRVATGWAGAVELTGKTDIRTEYRDDATTGVGRIGSGYFSLAPELTVRHHGDAVEASGKGRVEWWAGTVGGDWLNASSRADVSREFDRGGIDVYGLLQRETMTGLQVDASGLVVARLSRTLAGTGVSMHRTVTERFGTDLVYGYTVARSHTVGVSDVITHDLRAVGRWDASDTQVGEGSVTWTSLRSGQVSVNVTDALSAQYHHTYRMTERTRVEGTIGGDLVVARMGDSPRATLDEGWIGRAALTHELTAGTLSLAAGQSVLPSVLGVLVLTRQADAQIRLAVSEYVSGGATADLYQSQPLSIGGAQDSTAFRLGSDLSATLSPTLALVGSYVYLQSQAGRQRTRSHSVIVTLTHAWERRP